MTLVTSHTAHTQRHHSSLDSILFSPEGGQDPINGALKNGEAGWFRRTEEQVEKGGFLSLE